MHQIKKKGLAMLLACCCVLPMAPVEGNAAGISVSTNTTPTGTYSSFQKADTLKSDTMVYDTLSSSNNVHYYKYTADKTGYFTITLAQTAGKGTWNFAVYDADNGNQELESQTLASNYTSRIYNLRPGKSVYIKVERVASVDVSILDHQISQDYQYSLLVKTTAASDWEQEDNDVQTAANDLPDGTWINGSSYKASDVDWYVYTVPQTGYFTYEFQGTTNLIEQWNVYLYDENGKELDKNIKTKNIMSKKFTVPVGKKVYIKVVGPQNAKGDSYKIRSNYYATEAWEREPNDTKEEATELENGVELSGTNASEDVDWFAYTVTGRGYFTVTFTSVDDSYHTCNVYVYDEKMNLLEKSLNAQTFTSGKYAFAVGQKVYVKVNNGFGSQYKIGVDFKKSSFWEKESNDTMATATDVTAGKSVHGSISSKKDVDYYRYVTTGSGSFQFQFANVDAGTNQFWKLSVYDGKKNLLQTIETEDDLETKTANFSFRKNQEIYLKVERDINDYACGQEYSVTVRKKGGTWEQEYNDTFATATALKTAKTYKANNYAIKDSDYFVYKAAKAGKYSVQVNLPDSGYWKVCVYDQNKKLLKQEDYAQSAQKFTVSAKKGQKVYVLVKARTKSAVGRAYRVTVKQK